MKNPSKLTKALGYHFKNTALLAQALTHRSVGHQHNERLEFLGDSILNFVIAEALFSRFPEAKEGELTRMRARLVNERTLSEIAQDLQLAPFLQVGEGERKSGGVDRASMQADALEAVVGAIFLDGGLVACQSCLTQWYAARWEGVSPDLEKDPKTVLQEYLQAKKQPLPLYTVAQLAGEAHQQIFYVQCAVDNYQVQGIGSNRRRAEQDAASKMLEKLIGSPSGPR